MRRPSQTLESMPAVPKTLPAPAVGAVQAEELLETMRLVRQDVANYSLRVEGLPNQLSALTLELGAMKKVLGASIDTLGAEISESREHSKERDALLGTILGRLEHEVGQIHTVVDRLGEMVTGTNELAKSALDVANEANAKAEKLLTLGGNTYTAVTGRAHVDDRRATPAPPAQRRPKRPPR